MLSRFFAVVLSLSLFTACGPEGSSEESNSTPPVAKPAPQPSPSPAPAPTPSKLEGRVVATNGKPVSSVAVAIAGQPAVNTDADGRFSFSGVAAPYDVTLIDARAKVAVVYKGLRRMDPTLLHFGADTGSRNFAQIAQTAQSASGPVQSDEVVTTTFASDDGFGFGYAYGYCSSCYVSVQPSWTGAASNTGKLISLHYKYSATTMLATEFKGFASTAMTVSAGGSFDVKTGLVAVTSKSVSGVVRAAANYAITRKQMSLVSGDATVLRFTDDSGSPGFSYVTPNAPGLAVRLTASANRTSYGFAMVSKTNIAVDASSVSLDVPAAPEAILPADGASNVDTSMKFSWTPSNPVSIAMFVPVAEGNPAFYVVTGDSTASVPNLSEHGLALPSGGLYDWYAASVSPIADIDAAASTAMQRAWAGLGDWGYASSYSRRFKAR